MTSKYEIVRGDSDIITISMENELGVQIPFSSGDTVRFTVKSNDSTETKILQKSVTSFSSGKAIVNILPTDTSSLSYGVYYYDVQWTRADGYKKTIVPKSTFIIQPEITYE